MDSTNTTNDTLHIPISNDTFNIPIVLNKPFQAAWASAIIFVNVLFITALICNRKRIHWRRYAHILNLSITDFFTGITLLVEVLVIIWEDKKSSNRLSIGLQTAITACMLVLSCSHAGICRSQYVAVKKPLEYRNQVRWRRILLRIAISDSIIILYSASKIYMLHSYKESSTQRATFSHVELGLVGSGIIYSIVTWIYVLRIAYKSQYERSKRKCGQCPIRKPNGQIAVKLVLKLILHTIKHYRSLMTASLSLLIFLCSFVPLYGVWTHLAILGEDIYTCDYAAVRIALVLFFLRGVLDPIVYVLRDAKLTDFVLMRYLCCFAKFRKSSNIRKQQNSSVVSRISHSKTDSLRYEREDNSSSEENSDGMSSPDKEIQTTTGLKF